MMGGLISAAQWESFDEVGYLRLGKVMEEGELERLRGRIDDIMLGKAGLDFSRLLMQLDSETGRYEDAGVRARRHKGSTLSYRKIQDVEFDPMFLAFLQRPVFREICERTHGAGTAIAAFRAMFMNKPAGKGTFLPWHQDRWSFLDRDPVLTLWTALDPATKANGCVQMIPGSHKRGVINPSHGSGFLTAEQAAEFCSAEKVEFLEVEAGESVLMHNYLLHASDVNRTESPRRAFSVCYMDARTKASNGERFSVVFGEGAMVLQAS